MRDNNAINGIFIVISTTGTLVKLYFSFFIKVVDDFIANKLISKLIAHAGLLMCLI